MIVPTEDTPAKLGFSPTSKHMRQGRGNIVYVAAEDGADGTMNWPMFKLEGVVLPWGTGKFHTLGLPAGPDTEVRSSL